MVRDVTSGLFTWAYSKPRCYGYTADHVIVSIQLDKSNIRGDLKESSCKTGASEK